MKKSSKGMFEVPGFPISLPIVPEKMKRQAGNGFRKDPDAGIDRRHLHGGPLIDGLPGRRASKEKPVPAAQQTVPGFVPGFEEFGK